MSEKKQVLTSVKIDTDLFDKFKIECIKRKFSFQKLSERAIHIYLTNEDFKRLKKSLQIFVNTKQNILIVSYSYI